MKATAKQTIEALERILKAIDKIMASQNDTIRPTELMALSDDIRAIRHVIEAIKHRYSG